jgi:hypothetical protein
MKKTTQIHYALAALAAASLSKHSITATFSGDPKFALSTSSPVTVLIEKDDTETAH